MGAGGTSSVGNTSISSTPTEAEEGRRVSTIFWLVITVEFFGMFMTAAAIARSQWKTPIEIPRFDLSPKNFSLPRPTISMPRPITVKPPRQTPQNSKETTPKNFSLPSPITVKPPRQTPQNSKETTPKNFSLPSPITVKPPRQTPQNSKETTPKNFSLPSPITVKPPRLAPQNSKETNKMVSNILNNMNPSVNPCNDFYEYSCGNWGKFNPQPTGPRLVHWTNFHRLDQKESDVLHGLLMKTSFNEDNKTRSIKQDYKTCLEETSKFDMNIIRKFRPYREWSKLKLTDREEKFFLNFKRNLPTVRQWAVRDHCLDKVQEEPENKRWLEHLYMKNQILDDVKVKQISGIMKNIQNSLGDLLGKSTTPWTKDEGSKWTARANKIRNILKKVEPCVGYFKGLLNKDQFSVTMLDFEYIMDRIFLVTSTDLTDPFDYQDIKNYTAKCYWRTSPFDTLAGYNLLGRSIEVPYSFIQTPFFDNLRPSAMNYGAIGSILGHEIAHAVRMQEYQKRNDIGPATTCLIDQYSNFSVTIKNTTVFLNTTIPKGINVLNGTATLEENFSDNVGLRAALEAYRVLPSKFKQNGVSGLKQFSDEQLFFLAYGQAWCSEIPVEIVGYQLLTDEHSPEKFRVLGTLRNSDEFAAAFNCRKGSPMNPVKKCRLF